MIADLHGAILTVNWKPKQCPHNILHHLLFINIDASHSYVSSVYLPFIKPTIVLHQWKFVTLDKFLC